MRKTVSGIILALLLTTMSMLAYEVRSVKANGTIYIRADGSIDPPDVPIQRFDNLYILTDNITESIVIQRDSIVIDGNGYVIEGPGSEKETEGISLSSRKNVTVSNIKIKNFYIGIYLNESSFNMITGNIIYGDSVTVNTKGVKLDYSSNNTVSGNSVVNCNFGIGLYYSSNNTIESNNATMTNYGISLRCSSNNLIYGNSLTKNNEFGILLLHSCSNNSVYKNNLTENDIGIRIENSSSNAIYSNIITASNELGIHLENSSSNVIYENHLENNNGSGIVLYYSANNNVHSNYLTANNGSGIGLSQSSNNTIYGNNVYDNEFFGFLLMVSSNNKVCSNYVAKNNVGIYLGENSRNNIIYGNDVKTNDQFGIVLVNSVSNIVYGNDIKSNKCGLSLDNSPNNTIFHNNFLINTDLQVYSKESVNVWDSDYPDGGNFWSDYTGLDEKSGSGQDQLGSDGMGDAPYVIDEDNRDKYPLIVAISLGIDITMPTMSITVTPSNPSETQNITFSVIANDDPCGSGISNITLYIDDDAVQTWITAGTHTYMGGPYSRGTHTYYVIAIDKASNQRRYPTTGNEKSTVSAPSLPLELVTAITLIAVLATAIIIILTLKKRRKKTETTNSKPFIST